MPIDDLYKNLQEADPDSLPKFEEESWKKMEMLLDKHLPENNGRVFPYVLFLGCVILASLTTFLPVKRILRPADGSVTTSNKVTTEPVRAIQKVNRHAAPIYGDNTSTLNLPGNDIGKEQTSQTPDGSTTGLLPATAKALTRPDKPSFLYTSNNKTGNKEVLNDQLPTVADEVELTATGRAVSITNNNHFLLRKNVQVERSLLFTTHENKPTVTKIKKNELSLTLSTGLETPGTGFKTFGRLTPVVGIGLMYTIGNKLILRTGVATASKIYSAHDKDYNPANSYWASYTYFKEIEADCKVIEIPLGIAYKVVGGKKTNVYVAAGSSSVIMRRESYDYYYKNQAGRDTVTHRAWNNNSFHLFSSVNLSAIAERKLSSRFSLMAEPSLKIPSGGIGVGNIRLYNAGLTITAKFKLR